MYIRKRTIRFGIIFLSLIFGLFYFSAKLLLIQFFRSNHLASLAEKQHNHSIKLEPVRGTIFDRRLRPLAVNVSVYSLFANPRLMQDADRERAIEELSKLLALDKNFLRDRLSKPKYFVWLARKLPMPVMEKIQAMKIRGLDFIKESKRYYPNQTLASHVIGFAGMDNEGLEGLELQYDNYLRGEAGWTQIVRDAHHRELLLETGFIPPQDGFSIVLTIDETIQYIAERALDKAYKTHHAASASIVVMDPYTGEILALANRPTYNLSEFAESNPESRTNRAVVHVYEPGSVFKIVAAAAALEEEAFDETDKIFCENGEYKVANNILHDHHPHGTLTFREVIEQSSNIGTTKIAQKLGPDTYYKYAHRFGFGQRTGIDLAGEIPGVLKPPAQWSKTSIGAIPIGQEVLVTPLQLAAAMSVIANGGNYIRPFMVKYVKDNQDELIQAFHSQIVDRAISEDTARRVRAILQGVVENGTGKRAKVEGIRVAGKTGTSQKVVNGQYSHNKFYASFIGFAPVENPQIVVVVTVDEPHPSYFGGTVAAPVFQEVVVNALKYLEASDDIIVQDREKNAVKEIVRRDL